MATPPRRALPVPPGPPGNAYYTTHREASPSPGAMDIYSYGNPYSAPYPYPHFLPQSVPYPDEQPSMLRGGTLLHKGFYDLLSMIPTTPSRMLWRTSKSQSRVLEGERSARTWYPSPLALLHASDAEQAEALLTRWGPEGQGKLGDPLWADPIKDRLRQLNQARAVNEVVNGLKPSQSSMIRQGAGDPPPLRVVNGISTTTSSTLTTAARENVSLSPVVPSGLPSSISPYQTVGQGGNSTIRWTAGLPAHPEHEQEDDHASDPDKELPDVPQAPVRKPIVPSLATLEKAVSAKIYFENLYFPLLRHPPSREQRRIAMEKDMMNMQMNEAQKEYLRSRWRQNETDYLRDRRRKVDVSAFVKLKTIGHGAFGVVSLVRERSTGQLFAMKQLRKTDMLRKGQEGHVRAERDLLKSASLVNSPGGADWIVRLHYSFQDRDHLYLVLEYMGGGDLLNLLIERDVFEEDFTRFYVAEMVLAIESCHKHGFIHRDIKPDNFLFDPQGHIKLSDFGLATDLHWAHDTSYYEQQRLHLLHKHGIDLEDNFGPSDGTRTKRLDRKEVERLMGGGDGQGGIFTWRERNRRKVRVHDAVPQCGTNSYMSPEVIRGHGYTYSCDWWSLGRHVTRQKILNWKQSLRFPSRPRVSHEGVSLMEQLLCEPEDRLGSQASSSVSRPNSMIVQARRSGFISIAGAAGSVDGAHLIKAHPWFRGIDWDNMHRYPAPYRPELRHPEDTRHFDDDIPPEPLAPANGAAADATRDPLLRDRVHGQEILEVRKALAFAGFTHKSPRVISYVRADKAFDPEPDTYGHEETERGRSTVREDRDIGKGRAISM
ncbi:kinase-like domain-containing protein [Fomitopsis serialis]|uniref:kinase-like domain-containing protein n=1 Tax=Fomitopsis serialis TaxID=139415 RepID=UPI0020084BD7|nr:kinase-like domain-containing protein [Neoantrodia serialis]KAH9935291.1 kinase-like domain-containing protein [Neoantrodia serialis]